MRIPDSVKVGPYVYRICQPESVTSGSSALYGQADHEQHVIQIGAKFPPDKQLVTFFHEVLHALDVAYRLKLSEGQVDVLACVLVQFLKDNGFLE